MIRTIMSQTDSLESLHRLVIYWILLQKVRLSHASLLRNELTDIADIDERLGAANAQLEKANQQNHDLSKREVEVDQKMRSIDDQQAKLNDDRRNLTQERNDFRERKKGVDETLQKATAEIARLRSLLDDSKQHEIATNRYDVDY